MPNEDKTTARHDDSVMTSLRELAQIETARVTEEQLELERKTLQQRSEQLAIERARLDAERRQVAQSERTAVERERQVHAKFEEAITDLRQETRTEARRFEQRLAEEIAVAIRTPTLATAITSGRNSLTKALWIGFAATVVAAVALWYAYTAERHQNTLRGEVTALHSKLATAHGIIESQQSDISHAEGKIQSVLDKLASIERTVPTTRPATPTVRPTIKSRRGGRRGERDTRSSESERIGEECKNSDDPLCGLETGVR